MLKNIILWATLAFISVFIAGDMHHQATAATIPTSKETNNPKKYTFVFFVQDLSCTDIDGPGLPNIKKLKTEGISYSHLAQDISTQNSEPHTNVLAHKNNQLLLTRTLAANGVDCLAVDGTGTITPSIAKENYLDLIAEKNDQLAVDKLIDRISNNPYQFTAIFLDDTSVPDKTNNSSYQRLSLADNQVGRVLDQLIKSEILSNSTIIVTGNGESPPLIMYNSNTSKGEIFIHCRQADIAPTICKIHDIIPPHDMPGHILYEALPTAGQTLTSDLKKRVIDLQRECQQYNQQINMMHKERLSIETQKAEIKKERENIHRIISGKDSTIQRLVGQIKILKFLGAVIIILLLVGYIFQYRWLRKKFLIFP